jgi:hypothetical protein
MSQPFNFQTPNPSHKHFEEFARSKEEHLKQKIGRQEPQNRHLWAIVSFLMLSLVALGIFTLLQKQDSDRQIAALQKGSVAGVNDRSEFDKNIITAEAFSIVTNQPIPSSYKLERQMVSSPYLEGKPAVVSRFQATVQKEGKDLVSGLEAWVTEYDNKLDRSSFTEQVATKLGGDYQVQSQDVVLPKDIKVTRIATSNPSLAYYVAVTSDNYYVFKISNQTAQYSDLADLSRFTENLLESLYLN